jgi:uncharacterized protein with GYD domain
MPRYVSIATYSPAAFAAFVNNPQARTAVAADLLRKLGGTLISMDFSTGDFDVLLIFEVPDEVTATAFALRVQSAGHFKSNRIVRLLSGDEFLDAQRKAYGLSYEAPKT